jgi:hypothetical protein
MSNYFLEIRGFIDDSVADKLLQKYQYKRVEVNVEQLVNYVDMHPGGEVIPTGATGVETNKRTLIVKESLSVPNTITWEDYKNLNLDLGNFILNKLIEAII